MMTKRAGAFLVVSALQAFLVCAGAGAAEDNGDEMARMKAAAAKVRELEAVMDHYYRGTSVDALRERVNAMVKEHNALVEERNGDLDESGKKVDEARAPVERLKAEVDRMDARLKREPDPADRAAVNAYNDLVKQRNAAVKRFNTMNDAVNAVVNAHNARVKKVKAELAFTSGLLDAARAEYKEKADALEAFEKAGDDLAFFESANHLLARILAETRRPDVDAGWGPLAAKLRSIRRELGRRAMALHAAKEHGLVIVEVAVSGEPSWLIVDTGAMRTTVGPGLVDVLGLSGKLGDEVEIVLAGGMRTKGREITLPSVKVSGVTERDVPAAAVKVSDVGVDGLLGQSFLKRFVYTIDESSKEKLILRPRKAE